MPHKSSNQNYVVIKKFLCLCDNVFDTAKLAWYDKNVGFCIPKTWQILMNVTGTFHQA